MYDFIEACINGDLYKVKCFIKNRVDINAKGDCSWTALMYASWNNRLEIVKFLIENVANLNEKDKDGNTALILASSNGHLEVTKYLIDNGANVNIKNNQNETVLITMLISCIKTFKENKVNEHIVLNRCFKIVKCLIENGADVNIKNNEGKTALDLAEENGYEEIAEILKNAGAKHGNEIQ